MIVFDRHVVLGLNHFEKNTIFFLYIYIYIYIVLYIVAKGKYLITFSSLVKGIMLSITKFIQEIIHTCIDMSSCWPPSTISKF